MAKLYSVVSLLALVTAGAHADGQTPIAQAPVAQDGSHRSPRGGSGYGQYYGYQQMYNTCPPTFELRMLMSSYGPYAVCACPRGTYQTQGYGQQYCAPYPHQKPQHEQGAHQDTTPQYAPSLEEDELEEDEEFFPTTEDSQPAEPEPVTPPAEPEQPPAPPAAEQPQSEGTPPSSDAPATPAEPSSEDPAAAAAAAVAPATPPVAQEGIPPPPPPPPPPAAPLNEAQPRLLVPEPGTMEMEESDSGNQDVVIAAAVVGSIVGLLLLATGLAALVVVQRRRRTRLTAGLPPHVRQAPTYHKYPEPIQYFHDEDLVCPDSPIFVNPHSVV